MSTPTKVVEDGLGAPDQRGGGRRWAWLAAGVVLGLGLSFVMSTLEPLPTLPVSSDLGPADLVVDNPGGVDDVIPGFPDGLAAISSPDGQTLELITWPVAGPSFLRPVPLGTFPGPAHVVFDSSGRHIASLRMIPGEDGFGLFAGPPTSVRLVAANVTGFAWHDSEPGTLVFSTNQGSQTSLRRLTGTRRAPEQLLTLDIEGAVVGWGDWGLALQDPDQEMVTLVDDDGDIVTTAPGRFLGSSGKGMMAVHDEKVYVLASVGLPVGAYVDPSMVGEPRALRFSPDGEMYAILGNEGIAVFTTVYGELVMSVPARIGAPTVIWSSDGRFVVSPSVRGAIVMDTVEGTTQYVLDNQTLHGVVVIPLTE
jgi:hypothetical protein